MLQKHAIAPSFGPEIDIYRGGKGAPLVYLHGFASVTPDDEMLAALAQHFEVFAPVQLGRRDLSDLDEMRDIRDLALYYDSLFDHLKLDGITLVGHCFGGMLAGEIAALSPKRIKALALISPLGLWNDAAPVADPFGVPAMALGDLFWRGATRRNDKISLSAADGTAEGMIAQANGMGSIARYIWPIPDKGLRRRLYRITAPSLIVFGDGDALVPASYADDFARAIKGARKLMLKGSHMIPFEQPAEIAEAIRAL